MSFELRGFSRNRSVVRQNTLPNVSAHAIHRRVEMCTKRTRQSANTKQQEHGGTHPQKGAVAGQVRERQDVEDEEEKERARVETLLKTRQKAVEMDSELWRVTQEARCVVRITKVGAIASLLSRGTVANSIKDTTTHTTTFSSNKPTAA